MTKITNPILILFFLSLNLTCSERFSNTWSPGFAFDFTEEKFKDELQDATSPVLPPKMWDSGGDKGLVTSSNLLASRVGAKVLADGGNSIDAAIATLWSLCVLNPHQVGIGGFGVAIHYDAKKQKPMVFEALAAQPAKADTKNTFRFRRYDKNKDEYKDRYINNYYERTTGGRATGTPGLVKLIFDLAAKAGSGKIKMQQLAEPAIDFGRYGFRVSPELHMAIVAQRKRFKFYTESRDLYYKREQDLRVGQVLAQEDLAATIEEIAEGGADVFYKGDIAQDIVAAVQNSQFPGRLSLDDLERYKVRTYRPLKMKFSGRTVFSSSGSTAGVALIMALKSAKTLRKRFNVKDYNHRDIMSGHLLLESQKQAYSDFLIYGADVAVDYPWHSSDLVTDKNIKQKLKIADKDLAELTPMAAGKLPKYNGPLIKPKHPSELGSAGVTVSAVDSAGNVTVITASLEFQFGNAEVLPGRGFVLNNALTAFEHVDDYPNSLEAGKRPDGGKRPRSGLAPVLVVKQKSVEAALGAGSDPKDVGSLVSVMLNRYFGGYDWQEAAFAPRLVNLNNKLIRSEQPILRNRAFVNPLKAKGHKFIRRQSLFKQTFNPVYGLYLDDLGIQWGITDMRGEGGSVSVEPCIKAAVCRRLKGKKDQKKP